MYYLDSRQLSRYAAERSEGRVDEALCR